MVEKVWWCAHSFGCDRDRKSGGHIHDITVSRSACYGAWWRATTRSATANRSRLSICDWPSENFLTPSSIIMQNLVVVTHTVCTHVDPKNWIPRTGRDWPHGNTFILRCYTKCRRCTSHRFRTGGRPWDVCVADSLETRFSTACFTVSNLVIMAQTIRAQLTDIRHKKFTSPVPPFKTVTDRSATLTS